MAQRLNRGVQKVAKQREQEDAQEFLTFLLDSTHQELLKLRAMYGTEGESAAALKKRIGGINYIFWCRLMRKQALFSTAQRCCTQQDSVILSTTRRMSCFMDTTIQTIKLIV